MGDSVTACCKSNNVRVPFPSTGHHPPTRTAATTSNYFTIQPNTPPLYFFHFSNSLPLTSHTRDGQMQHLTTGETGNAT